MEPASPPCAAASERCPARPAFASPLLFSHQEKRHDPGGLLPAPR
jgi:hypothetical protein